MPGDQPRSKWRAYLHPAEWLLRARIWLMSLAFEDDDEFLAERSGTSEEERLDTSLRLMASAADTRKQRKHES